MQASQGCGKNGLGQGRHWHRRKASKTEGVSARKGLLQGSREATGHILFVHRAGAPDGLCAGGTHGTSRWVGQLCGGNE